MSFTPSCITKLKQICTKAGMSHVTWVWPKSWAEPSHLSQTQAWADPSHLSSTSLLTQWTVYVTLCNEASVGSWRTSTLQQPSPMYEWRNSQWYLIGWIIYSNLFTLCSWASSFYQDMDLTLAFWVAFRLKLRSAFLRLLACPKTWLNHQDRWADSSCILQHLPRHSVQQAVPCPKSLGSIAFRVVQMPRKA